MNDKYRAEELFERVESGERSRELVEELNNLRDTENDDARDLIAIGLYTILAEEPHLFVRNPDDLFDDLHSVDEVTPPGARITFSWVAENPPDKLTEYIDPELLELLNHRDDLIRGSACRILAHFAGTDVSTVEGTAVGLRHLLKDENTVVQGHACLALGHLEDETALRQIKQLQLSDSQYTRAVAEWATEKIQTDRGGESIRWKHKDLFECDPVEFERVVAALWSEMGYSTKVTQRAKDGGYDVDARKKDKRILIQAKRHQNRVGVKTVRETAGLLEIEDADRVVVVTSSSFTNTVEKTDRIELLDGKQLCDLLTAHNIPRDEYS